MAETTVRYLVTLRRGRKRAVLTMNGGELFSDRDWAWAGVQLAFRDGWQEAKVETLDKAADGKLIRRLVEYHKPNCACAGRVEARAKHTSLADLARPYAAPDASGRETDSVAGPAPRHDGTTPVGTCPGEAASVRCTTQATGPNAARRV
ncbi:MAG: hypothetical protein ACJ79S_15315 [Gemmatimonadaceae bacterium]